MRTSKKGFGPLIAVAVLGVAGLLLAEPLSHWIAGWRSRAGGPVVARVVQAEGSVRRIHSGQSDLLPSPLNTPVELHDGDRLETSAQSRAVFILNSQDEFELPSTSALQLQLWNPKDVGSAVYVVSTLGGLEHRHGGIRGKAYVVKEGRLYLPGQKPLQKAMALTVLKAAPLDLHLAENENAAALPTEFEADSSSDMVTEAAESTGADPETLSNEYIDENILSHQGQLQKCWLTRLKDVPGLKGQVVVQFEISKRGKVKEAKVVDATLTDEILQKCILSVFERITFRAYKGSEISLSYPVNFE